MFGSCANFSRFTKQLLGHKLATISLVVVLIYLALAMCSFFGVIANSWGEQIGPSYQAPSWDHIFGTDILGRSVAFKVIKGVEVAMLVGCFSAIISTLIGTFLGLVSGYFGGKLDEIIVWLYSTQTSIPYILLVIAISYTMGKGISSICWALGLTSWINLCRIVRAEVIKHREREYVLAAKALGANDLRVILKHLLPNVTHLLIVNFSLTFQMAIKSEVILSYMGIGVQGVPSWGTMIDESKLELARGAWWQLTSATIAMMIIILAFNILGDFFRDVIDPKLRGQRYE